MPQAASFASVRVGFERSMRSVYERLVRGADERPDGGKANKIEEAPFRTFKDLFMLAACRGYQLGERMPAQGPRDQPIHGDVFSQDVDLPILKALAIASSNDITVLGRPDDVMRIAEEYANAGIRDLQEMLLDQFNRPLWSLVTLLREHEIIAPQAPGRDVDAINTGG